MYNAKLNGEKLEISIDKETYSNVRAIPVGNKLFNNMRVNLLDFTNIADSHRLTAVDRCGTGYVMGILEERMDLEATLKPLAPSTARCLLQRDASTSKNGKCSCKSKALSPNKLWVRKRNKIYLN